MILKSSSSLKRTVLIAVLIGALTSIAVGPTSAHAAKPNNQGCLGADFSTYARYGSAISGPGSEFGQFNATLAHAVPGLGLPIQFHLAGFIPDGYVVNSCNNP